MAGRAPGASTGEVILRDVTDGDLPILFEYQLDPEANWMAAFEARDRDSFMAHWNRILADETVVKRTILVDGQVAGNIVSFEQDGQREVGYWLGRDFWGKGVATRALAAFLDQEIRRPLYAYVAKHNAASIRVLEKCGFTILGEVRGIAVVDGHDVDGFILALKADPGDDVE